MKKLRYITVCFAALALSSGAAFAQNYIGGGALTGYEFGVYDMLNLSQHNTALTTARASAMGGAFTSLGADLSSMSINPAGIAMYRGGAWGFTPAMNFSDTKSSLTSTEARSNRFAFNNIGIVSEVYRSSRNLTNVNIGFSYNKLADFNNRSYVRPGAGKYSIADIFAYQLNGLYGVMGGYTEDLGVQLGWLKGDPFYNNNIALSEWGAVMGYETGLSAAMNPGNSNQDLYRRDGIASGASVMPGMEIENRGSVGEYNFSLGMNFDSKLYLGFGISIQDIYLLRKIYYDEYYENNNSGSIKSMQYDQTVKMSGAGVNFKVGLTYRPFPALRIGLALHTPTFTNITHEYNAGMRAEPMLSGGAKTSRTPLNVYDYSYNSPTRLLAGISYTLGNFGVLAVDYERTWYNGMRLTSGGFDDREYYKAQIQTELLPGNSIKVGLEVKPVPVMAVRAGYSYYSSPVETENYFYSKPIMAQTNNLSAGVGFRIGPNANLDIAYVYSNNKYADFDLFYYHGKYRDESGSIVNTNEAVTTADSPVNDLVLHRHTAIVSLGFMF